MLDVFGIICLCIETDTLIKDVEHIEHGQITEHLLGILIKLTITRIDLCQECLSLLCGFRNGLMELLNGFSTTFTGIDELTEWSHDGYPLSK